MQGFFGCYAFVVNAKIKEDITVYFFYTYYVFAIFFLVCISFIFGKRRVLWLLLVDICVPVRKTLISTKVFIVNVG